MDDFKDSPAYEAFSLVHGERAKTYGHPRFDFKAIAKIWTGLLSDKLKPGEELDEYRVAILMSGLKLARLVKSPKHHDSRVDTIGYILTMERLDEPEGVTQDHDPDCQFHPTVADMEKEVLNPLTGKPMQPGEVCASLGEQDVLVHHIPVDDSGKMPCCGQTPFDVIGDKLAMDVNLVTCKGLAVEVTEPLPERPQFATGGFIEGSGGNSGDSVPVIFHHSHNFPVTQQMPFTFTGEKVEIQPHGHELVREGETDPSTYNDEIR